MKLSAIKAANAALAARAIPSAVGVFIGGTSGLGEAALKKFVVLSVKPRVYFCGRNTAAATRITTALHALNPRAEVHFLPATDLSSLHQSATIAHQIAAAEPKINLLVLSQGYASFGGHNPTADGIEKKLAVSVYSRLLFIRLLLPSLTRAAAEDVALGGRAMSIYAPGDEGRIDEADLAMSDPASFSLARAAQQGTAMNSAALAHLAEVHPEVGWLHVFPGFVAATGYMRETPWWGRAMMGVAGVAATAPEDAGEGLAWLGTDEKWKTGLGLVDWRGGDRDTRTGQTAWWGRVTGAGGWWREGLGRVVWEGVAAKTEEVLRGKGVEG
ncbi:hypothetical protein EDC01DRAFT_615306 [Geopyxis carbonaria]|nr:hypothetical protein EDC01DRAFT_615306 [Geopyxis carbonaria]